MNDKVDFGTVAIVGVGLLGGSIGKALLLGGFAKNVVGVGRSPDRLADAVRLGVITEYTTKLSDIAGSSNIVILCTPVSHIIADLPKTLSLANKYTTVTDVGSVKTSIVGAAQGDSRFVGGHPMAGSEQTGAVSARADLFHDATWVLTPTEQTDPVSLSKVRSLAQLLGAATISLTPERHDQAVAVTSHVPHAISTALMRLAARKSETASEIQQLTAGSFADVTRVAASSPELWTDIFQYNRSALIEALTEYRTEIDGFLDDLNDHDFESLKERFASGSDAKRSWQNQ